MKTLAPQNRKSLSMLTAMILMSASALFFTGCQKDEMPAPKPQLDQQAINSDVSRHATKSGEQAAGQSELATSGKTIQHITTPAFMMITIDHSSAQTSQPAYTIQITSDGTVLFTGRKNVATLGEKKFKISEDLTADLKNLFLQSNFNEIEDQPFIMDYASISTTFAAAKDLSPVTKIDYNNGSPSKLIELRRTAEKMLGIHKLTMGTRDFNGLRANMTQHD